jgi:hypothetical protein
MSQKVSFDFSNAKFMASDADVEAIRPRVLERSGEEMISLDGSTSLLIMTRKSLQGSSLLQRRSRTILMFFS